MEKIKKLIIILIVIILIIITMIVSIMMSATKAQNNEQKQEIQEQESLQKMVVDNESNTIKKITTEAEYLNVKKCISDYNTYSNYLYYAKQYKEVPENEKENVELKKTQLLKILPDFVIQTFKLDKENVYDEVGLLDKEIRIDNVYVSTQKVKGNNDSLDKINVKAYIANGVLIDRNNFQKTKFNIIVLMDTQNHTFYIVPQKYIEEEDIEIKEGNNLVLYDKDSIDDNEYNQYEETIGTEKEMSKEYFNRFKLNLTNDPSYIYNQFDEEYRNKRFGTYENFVNYIKNDKENFNKIRIASYQVNRNEENTEIEYVCKDQYENLYIFEQTTPLDFTLKLDTYTITTDKFKETYETAEDTKKIQMNIDKFFQMINRQDYINAYNCLAQSYKNNYFKTESEFTEYAKTNFYTYNRVSYLSCEQKGNKLYIFKIRLEDITGENTEKKEIKIVMQLNEGLDFEMSFGM